VAKGLGWGGVQGVKEACKRVKMKIKVNLEKLLDTNEKSVKSRGNPEGKGCRGSGVPRRGGKHGKCCGRKGLTRKLQEIETGHKQKGARVKRKPGHPKDVGLRHRRGRKRQRITHGRGGKG